MHCIRCTTLLAPRCCWSASRWPVPLSMATSCPRPSPCRLGSTRWAALVARVCCRCCTVRCGTPAAVQQAQHTQCLPQPAAWPANLKCRHPRPCTNQVAVFGRNVNGDGDESDQADATVGEWLPSRPVMLRGVRCIGVCTRLCEVTVSNGTVCMPVRPAWGSNRACPAWPLQS